MKTTQDKIDYFKGVKAQHEAFGKVDYKNSHRESIIRTYDFVIGKLEEWKKQED